jgi:hypothetical protein
MSPLVPRIRHAVPHGAVTRSHTPLPVVVHLVWHDGRETLEDAVALAWTREEVLVEWTTPWGDPHQVWLRAAHVSRRTSAVPGTSPPSGSAPDARA